jgi:hypothetical protein
MDIGPIVTAVKTVFTVFQNVNVLICQILMKGLFIYVN